VRTADVELATGPEHFREDGLVDDRGEREGGQREIEAAHLQRRQGE
jgi:hypothetical protein